MESVFKIFLVLHILGGSMALLGAPAALITRKGSPWHHRSGSFFFWGMTLVFFSSMYMSIAHEIPFLMMVGIFSYQMVLSGRRTLHYKKAGLFNPLKGIDGVIVIASAVSDLMLVGYGLFQIIFNHDAFGVVAIIFGMIGLLLIRRLYRRITGKEQSNTSWLFDHLGNMIGGYIAAVTAFLVVNVSTEYPVLLWLSPTVIGSGLIAYFISFYRSKLKSGKRVNELVTVPDEPSN